MAFVVYTFGEDGAVYYLAYGPRKASRWTPEPREAHGFKTKGAGLTAAIVPHLIALEHGEEAEIVCRRVMGLEEAGRYPQGKSG